jgi:hypothetical protein
VAPTAALIITEIACQIVFKWKKGECNFNLFCFEKKIVWKFIRNYLNCLKSWIVFISWILGWVGAQTITQRYCGFAMWFLRLHTTLLPNWSMIMFILYLWYYFTVLIDTIFLPLLIYLNDYASNLISLSILLYPKHIIPPLFTLLTYCLIPILQSYVVIYYIFFY